ncbi:MAG TPA: Tol-Pal system beta propeller repeat protein TolB [Stenotrophobium sp.]|jgi:TolB protein|nr:Tol-Pal system beta propeller repeat protein TolB [Stenotrophobium sp.]
MHLKHWLGLFLLLVSVTARADLEVTVSGGETGALPIAIVPFADPNGTNFDIAKIIEADLTRTGQFKALPRTDMLATPSQPSQINYANWRQVNMDNLVIGQLTKDANGRIKARFFLMDTLRGQQVLGYDMPAATPDRMRSIAHQIADLIYQKLTGIKGDFDTKIAYITATGMGVSRAFSLVVADADGYSPHVLATSREPLVSPAWSPDYTRIAYVGFDHSQSAIYIQTLATGKVRKVVAEKGINGSPAWSPDGRKLAVTLSFETNPDIYIIDLESGARRRLTTLYSIDTEPAWSPDGQNIVFTSDRGGQPQIYQMPVAGGDPRRLTFQGKQNLRASYSPDGKSLVLVNLTDSVYRIALLDLASGSMQYLSDGPLDESPGFSPNGNVIIYATQDGNGAELATVSLDGRVKQRMHQAGGDVREPAWSSLSP